MLHILISVTYACTLTASKLIYYLLASDFLEFWCIFSWNLSNLWRIRISLASLTMFWQLYSLHLILDFLMVDHTQRPTVTVLVVGLVCMECKGRVSFGLDGDMWVWNINIPLCKQAIYLCSRLSTKGNILPIPSIHFRLDNVIVSKYEIVSIRDTSWRITDSLMISPVSLTANPFKRLFKTNTMKWKTT